MNIGDFLKHNSQNIGINSTLKRHTSGLTHFSQCCISYRNQLFNLQCKSDDWFLYEMQHWSENGLNLRNKSLISFIHAKHDLNNAFRVI